MLHWLRMPLLFCVCVCVFECKRECVVLGTLWMIEGPGHELGWIIKAECWSRTSIFPAVCFIMTRVWKKKKKTNKEFKHFKPHARLLSISPGCRHTTVLVWAKSKHSGQKWALDNYAPTNAWGKKSTPKRSRNRVSQPPYIDLSANTALGLLGSCYTNNT